MFLENFGKRGRHNIFLAANTANNTSLTGAVIANSSNGLIGQDAIDGGNLTLNTKTLTYSNLNDYNNSSSNAIGFNVGLPVGFGGNSPSNLALTADPKNTNLALNYAANETQKEQITQATIGKATINLNGTVITNANDSDNANLNRDITTIQQTTQNTTSGGYNIDLNISLGVLNRAKELYDQGQLKKEAIKNLSGTGKLYGNALFGVGTEGNSSKDAVPGTLPWFSRVANENNTVVIKTTIDGKEVEYATNYPAPSLLPGLGNKPNTGIAYDSCKTDLCRYLGSDRAPLFVGLDQAIFGLNSAAAFHDSGKYSNNALITAATIPPYFLFNYIGAVGTFFDVGNWKQNFVDPKTNIFVKPEPQQLKQPITQIEIPQIQQNSLNQNLQPQQILPNQINNSVNLKFYEVKNAQAINFN